MGLTAAVYKRLEEMSFNKEDLRFITVEPGTGAIDFDDAALYCAWNDKVQAVEKRIGNIALVSSLRTELEEVLGDSSSQTLLISKVLYNGTHCGDFIPMDLSSLKHEIARIRGIAGQHMSPVLKVLLADMEELIAASERHGNPIVFI